MRLPRLAGAAITALSKPTRALSSMKRGGRWRIIDLHGREVAQVVPKTPKVGQWSTSPDGKYLAYLGFSGEWYSSDHILLIILRLGENHSEAEYPVRTSADRPIHWDAGSNAVYGDGVEDSGTWRVRPGEGALEKIPDRLLAASTDFAVSSRGVFLIAPDLVPNGGGLKMTEWHGAEEKQLVDRGDFFGLSFSDAATMFACGERNLTASSAAIWVGSIQSGRAHVHELEDTKSLDPNASSPLAWRPTARTLAYCTVGGQVKVRSISIANDSGG